MGLQIYGTDEERRAYEAAVKAALAGEPVPTFDEMVLERARRVHDSLVKLPNGASGDAVVVGSLSWARSMADVE